VEIEFDGTLPADEAKSRLFVDISREAITNAVRHGFATKVFINADRMDSAYRLCVTDNGHPPSGQIEEGGGISGIRQKLKALGGSLAVNVMPAFTLTITLPVGGL